MIAGLDLEPWAGFFTATAGASAALVGLIIVSISVNIDTLLKFPGLVSRSGTAVAMLVLVTMVSLAGLIPELEATGFGITVLALSLVGLGFGLRSLWVLMRDVDGGRQVLAGVAKGGLALVPFVAFTVGGLLVLIEMPGGLLWIVIGTLAAVLVAIADVWVMLVEVRR